MLCYCPITLNVLAVTVRLFVIPQLLLDDRCRLIPRSIDLVTRLSG